MKDITGAEINIGDLVIRARFSNYLYTGFVYKITDKRIYISPYGYVNLYYDPQLLILNQAFPVQFIIPKLIGLLHSLISYSGLNNRTNSTHYSSLSPTQKELLDSLIHKYGVSLQELFDYGN